jgi:antitoxin MazE
VKAFKRANHRCDLAKIYISTIKASIMQTSIIKIGNSKGLRLSKAILEKYNISDKVEIILEKGRIILQPIETPRKNWEAAFQKMHAENDDQLLVGDVFDSEIFEECI